ncbi:SulP family inorganic anion transporter [Sphingomonas sp. AP4-R1]|uniref:SulP family inorganic anion transporter n=1 Tax=Sphingomonas sp. AP4-R1 TaxID=2735134 RepID=UPI00149348A6|nr:SulP family inorganic anion transporter [Sphingomonas sp. AP4-R1]QJU59314.1 SulP family inorganic anion transporter [Sphingomonas sp. AP4-R1]
MRSNDLVAGLCVAGLMLPEAVAYAGIAGLPPQHAIFAGIAGCLVYSLAGRSRFAIVSPTSSSAAILAATLAVVPLPGAARIAFATVVVGMAGLLFLLAAAVRLGGLTGFISRPVLRGFALGIALTIILHQFPVMTGASIQASSLAAFCLALIRSIPAWHPASVATGGIALVLLLALRRYPAVPGAFLVLVGGIAASYCLDLHNHGVGIVGAVETALTLPTFPRLDWNDISRLGQFTVPLVLILFAESWGTIRTLALRHGDVVDADHELAALGLANVASALVQGLPVGAGFSAGSANEAAGATSRMSSAIAAAGLAIILLMAMPFVALLPEPVLAAVVIAALVHALDPTPILRLWRLDRDQFVALGAAAGVLVLGVLDGMLVAIALSLAALVRRFATPRVARLGRLGHSHDYVDVARHADAVAPPHVAIWRPTAPLFFANAERMLGLVVSGARGDPAIHAVILSLEESYDLDSTALDALIEFDRTMTRDGFCVQLARAHDRVRDLIAAAGETDLDQRSAYSVDDAVAQIDATLSQGRNEP